MFKGTGKWEKKKEESVEKKTLAGAKKEERGRGPKRGKGSRFGTVIKKKGP